MRLGAVGVDGLDTALAQHGQQGEGHVGAVEHVDAGLFQHLGQALAAIGRVGGDAVPATFGIGLDGVEETGRQGHAAVAQPDARLVADPVERRQHVAGQLGGGIEHRVAQVAIEINRVQSVHADDVVEAEGDVADGGTISHDVSCVFCNPDRTTAALDGIK